MANGRFPYRGSTEAEVKRKVLTEKLPEMSASQSCTRVVGTVGAMVNVDVSFCRQVTVVGLRGFVAPHVDEEARGPHHDR